MPNRRLEVGKVFNGMQIRTSLQTEWGTTATADRNDPASYVLDLQVKVKIPKPHSNLAELSMLNAQLPALLPQLPALLQTAKISPFFDDLYRLKTAALQQSLLRLDNLLSRHNFYDCETILDLEHPVTKRRAVLMQADMDTDTDGSDSDRLPDVDGSSVTFQPFTSYKWGKKTLQPNSFIPPREAKLRQLQQDLASPGLSAAKQQETKSAVTRLKEEIADLRKYSYLVAGLDPYVVLPGSMFTAQNHSPFSPAVGDYCVVIFDNQIFPAVVGDVGPSDLIGEASLRICRQISAKADANNRAVNDLKVTYLLFPGTAEKPFEAPNFDKWRARCDALLRELGGYQGQLMAWEDLAKPKPPPATPAPSTPTPTPAPFAPTLGAPSVKPLASPASSPSPGITPAPHS